MVSAINSQVSPATLHHKTHPFSQRDPPQSSQICLDLLGDLSTTIQKFVNCSMTHAVPVTYCLDCDKTYDDLMRAYTNLNTKIDEGNVSCQSQFFNRDRLGLIQKSYLAGVNLWTGGNCDDCYETPLIVSNSTMVFLDLVGEFQVCTKQKAVEDVCTACSEIYNRVNKNYEAIKLHANDKVCFDLQDKINETRRFWSIDVMCNTNPDEKQIPFLILTAAITALPICFYVLMFAHTHHSESNQDSLSFLNDTTTEPEEQDFEGQQQGPSVNSIEPVSISS